MRVVALGAVLLAGCDLVFPLRPPESAVDLTDARFADAFQLDPTAPVFDLFNATPDPVLAGEDSLLSVHVQGNASASCFVVFSSPVGALSQNGAGLLPLDDQGMASLSVTFTAPSTFQTASITARVGNDATFANMNSAPLLLDVLQRFGHPGPLPTTQALFVEEVVAMRVTVPKLGRLASVGVTAASGGDARFAIYSDNNGAPDALLPGVVNPASTPLPSMLQLEELPASGLQQAGKLWIVMQVSADTSVASMSQPDSPNALTVRGPIKFTDSLPSSFSSFGTPAMNPNAWGMFITVAP